MIKENNIDGIIIVNKISGITSRDVVNRLNKVFNTKKIGHTGTLDPIASGVLVCTLGKCTKLNEFLTSTKKEYEVKFLLGWGTDTLDIDGKLTEISQKEVTDEEIEAVIKSFVGTYKQEVPLYSSVKVKGKKLYEYAREGIKVELPKKDVTIYSVENINRIKEVSFKTVVSKGTYIRSLVRDIGKKLGTCATMTELVRTKQGDYFIENAYTIDDVEEGNYKIIPLEEILKNIYSIDMDDTLYKKISNGVKYEENIDSEYIVFKYHGKIVCLYKKDGEHFKMHVKF